MVGAILSVLSLLTAQVVGPTTAQAAPAPADLTVQTISVVRACEAVADAKAPTDGVAFERLARTWFETCRQAVAMSPENSRVRLGMARALTVGGQQQEAIRHLRAAAARDDMDALYALYHIHATQDRAELNKKPLVPAAAAEYSLRRAAELGHPEAMMQLALMLDRGNGLVQHDPAAARFWVEELIRRIPDDQPPAHLVAMLGRLLAQSEDSADRTRGLRILDDLANNHGDVQRAIAITIRAESPLHARAFLD
jgi:TPR repeat protein